MKLSDAALEQARILQEFFAAFWAEALALGIVQQKALSRTDCLDLVSRFAQIAVDKWLALRDAACVEEAARAAEYLCDAEGGPIRCREERERWTTRLETLTRERDAARAEQREADAKLVESLGDNSNANAWYEHVDRPDWAEHIAAAIRAQTG